MNIFLASVSDWFDAIFTKEEIRELSKNCYILESFYYCRNRADKIKIWDREHFLLDSGAFTFKYNKKEALTDWYKYIDEYCDFIIDNNIKYFFELDIDNVVGYKKVKEFRRYIEQKVGRNCIPVWHISRGKEDFIETCKNYDYIAIGGIAGKEVLKNRNFIEKYLPTFISIAHSYNTKIHLLGYTITRNLKKFHADSVDSTSWLSGGRFGAIYKFNGFDISVVSKKMSGKRLNAYKVNYHNFYEWYKFQKYAEVNL